MKNPIILLFILLIGTSNIYAGGPWPQPKGKGYFKLSQWWTVFGQHYTDQGKIDPNVTTGIFNTAVYGEYGITNRLTGIVYAPLFSRNYMNNVVSATTSEVLIPGEALNSIGDIDLSIKYGLTQPGSKVPISATLLLGLPTGQVGGGTQGNLQTGDGEFNQMLRIDAGTGFKLDDETSSYVSGYAGVNNRTEGFSEEFRYGVEYGVGVLNSRLWLIGRLDVVESFKNGETAGTVNSTSIFANNTEFSSFSFEAAYYINKSFGFSASYASAFQGEIIAAAPSYSVGIFWDLK